MLRNACNVKKKKKGKERKKERRKTGLKDTEVNSKLQSSIRELILTPFFSSESNSRNPCPSKQIAKLSIILGIIVLQ